MADYSKQWAEINDPDFPWDFDIEEEIETIPHGYYKTLICEGFGFLAIERTTEGKIQLLFPGEDNLIRAVEYEKFIKSQKVANE